MIDAETPLLPCPFCGGPATLDTVGKGGSRHAIVACVDNQCPGLVHGVGAGIDNQRRSAIADWNRRAASPATAMQVKPLEWGERGFAHTDVGLVYRITKEPSYWRLSKIESASTLYSGYPTEQAAQAAAQADYERRINSALVTADDRTALLARIAELEKALTALAEGNLGSDPWQANYARIKDFAAAALAGAQS